MWSFEDFWKSLISMRDDGEDETIDFHSFLFSEQPDAATLEFLSCLARRNATLKDWLIHNVKVDLVVFVLVCHFQTNRSQ
jgi:hypothetical protein